MGVHVKTEDFKPTYSFVDYDDPERTQVLRGRDPEGEPLSPEPEDPTF